MRHGKFGCALLVFLNLCVGSFGPPVRETAAGWVTSNQTAAVWESYAVKGEEFSVEFPVTPAMTTNTTYLSDIHKDRQERTLGAYAEGVAFAVHAFENPSKSSLDDFIAEFFKPTTPGESRTLLNDGVNGKGYTFARDDLRGYTNFYATRRHLYVFQAVGSNLMQTAPLMKRFLDSIRFPQEPQGRLVRDGLGETSSVEPTLDRAEVFVGKAVTRRAFVITRPEPNYSETARRNLVAGTVVLRCVLSATGTITNIQTVSPLPDGLTEPAIYAAKQIKFVPAVKDGRFVSMWMELQYNFNLY